MADADWKRRVGIDINFSSDEDDDTSDGADTVCGSSSHNDGTVLQFRVDGDCTDSAESQELEEALRASSIDEVLSQWDQYGSTPPRTRIKNKNRSSKQRMEGGVKLRTGGRLPRPRADRRNTVDCALLNQMIMEPANSEEKVRSDKRSTQLLRESERDIKMAAAVTIVPMRSSANYGTQPTGGQILTGAQQTMSGQFVLEERAESMPISMANATAGAAGGVAPPTLIESCNRFMSVTSRPVGCRISAPPSSYRDCIFSNQPVLGGMAVGGIGGLVGGTGVGRESSIPQNRIKFHETFSDLIKLGSLDKERAARSGVLSTEERLWQTHVNDLIWLELQAWHADRSIEQQDRLLCQARQEIGDLLDEIMHFRFHRASVSRAMSEVSTATADSGIGTSSATTAGVGETNRFCFGCLSMYCKDCLEVQSAALKQVEDLLLRLESKECLFPSSRAMGLAFPVYQSESFVNRVKAMCLWYNMTRQHRMTLVILGKLLVRLQGPSKKESTIQWPIMEQNAESSSSSSVHDEGSSSAEGAQDSSINGGAAATTTSTGSTESSAAGGCSKRVQFAENGCDGGSASESVNSDETDFSDLSYKRQHTFPGDTEYGRYMNNLNFYNVQTLSELTLQSPQSMGNTLYRKYIENVLKTRGLGKSLTFLHRLHNVVLRKAQLTLEKPGRRQGDEFLFDEEDVPCIEPPLEREHEVELRRFGAWSVEAKELNLPSYVSAFLFLSLIPLEVIHEFLKMRLETRPTQPNPLSLEQHIKELKEGLTLAMIHRERFQKHVNTALFERELELDKYMHQMELFDETVRKIFELYLDLGEQWILETVPESHQKAALDEEWRFTKLISPMIPHQHGPAAKRYCSIVERILERTGSEMMRQLKELIEKSQYIEQTTEKKWQFFALCRETQRMFTTSREKALKTMAFAKTLFRDLEHADFHRDHCEEDSEGEGGANDADDLELEEGVVLRGGSNLRRRCSRLGASSSSPVCAEVAESLQMLKRNALLLRNKLAAVIEELQLLCSDASLEEFDDADRIGALTRVREILHQGYKFGFEYHKDVARLYETKLNNCRDCESELMLAKAIIQFAKLWMNFVMERCERGRGLRPRWANQGLEFLIAACDPLCTSHLTDGEFEDLKLKMDACISHVIGNIREPERIRKSPRSRKSSPSPSAAAVAAAVAATATASTVAGNAAAMTGRASIPMIHLPGKLYQNQLSLREDGVMLRAHSPTTVDPSDAMFRKQTSYDSVNEVKLRVPTAASTSLSADGSVHGTRPLRQLRVRDAVNTLDCKLDDRLRDRNLIGNVKEISYYSKTFNRARSVNFSWHRGIKIGQGRFGKVYTAVNNSTGELMAMKEIAIQPGETAAIRKVAEELKIFEGINHRHLVKYYGVEVHREELIIFMELCPEGTLESLVELNGGLPEAQTRRYTHQLLSAVAELHRNGVVHRDIKTANIFLHKDGNCLKLGDFGSAVKIQKHTTMAGELKGYVGTQAYMAPEVFTRTNTEGHGRAADIWSVGCVVVEMCSGRRPWHQFDSNFQIMFKVGMGESPEIPENLSEEGKDFVGICLQHDPKDRQKADELLQHIFCKVTFFDSEAIDKKLLGTFRRNLKSSSN